MIDFFDSAINWVADAASSVMDWVGDAIVNAISTLVGKGCYYICHAILTILKVFYDLFAVFSGMQRVTIDGSQDYLINIFFNNKSVINLYWAMGMLGVVFVFMFGVVAIIKKMFDYAEEEKRSIGIILGGMAKAILTILLLTAIMNAVLDLTNTLIQTVSSAFDKADSLSDVKEHVFTDKEYATMGRVLNTIGNYSLNPSYDSRYNINSCFNEIRPDLQLLDEAGIFDLTYITLDKEGRQIETWQSAIQSIVYSSNIYRELKLDVQYPQLTTAMLNVMKTLRTNGAFYPLSEYSADYYSVNAVSIDRVIFLTGTYNAARDARFNTDPSISDGLRGPYYVGQKDIYSFDSVSSDFQYKIGNGINYLMIAFLAFYTIKNLMRCIFNCVARIFTLVGLYIIAPVTVSTMPVDNGEKFKQWTMATTVELLQIFGSIIPMRLFIMFVPMILNSGLRLFDSTFMNFVGKTFLLVGVIETCDKFSGVITGILTNNAAYAALRAGDMSQRADAFSGALARTGAGLVKAGFGAAWGVTKAGVGAAANLGIGAAKLAGGTAAGLVKTGAAGVNALSGLFGSGAKGGSAEGDTIGGSGGTGDLSEKFGGGGDNGGGGDINVGGDVGGDVILGGGGGSNGGNNSGGGGGSNGGGGILGLGAGNGLESRLNSGDSGTVGGNGGTGDLSGKFGSEVGGGRMSDQNAANLAGAVDKLNDTSGLESRLSGNGESPSVGGASGGSDLSNKFSSEAAGASGGGSVGGGSVGGDVQGTTMSDAFDSFGWGLGAFGSSALSTVKDVGGAALSGVGEIGGAALSGLGDMYNALGSPLSVPDAPGGGGGGGGGGSSGGGGGGGGGGGYHGADDYAKYNQQPGQEEEGTQQGRTPPPKKKKGTATGRKRGKPVCGPSKIGDVYVADFGGFGCFAGTGCRTEKISRQNGGVPPFGRVQMGRKQLKRSFLRPNSPAMKKVAGVAVHRCVFTKVILRSGPLVVCCRPVSCRIGWLGTMTDSENTLF